MSGRFILLGSVIYLLFFTALATINPGPLVLAMPLVVYLGAALINRPPEVRLLVERHLDAEFIKQGLPVRVQLMITNLGNNLEEVLVEDQLPVGMTLTAGKSRSLSSLRSGETLNIDYTVKAPRGAYDWIETHVTAGDHLGVLREHVTLDVKSRLVYLPDTPRLRKVAIRPLRTHGHSGPIPSRKSGAGIDFFGLREYQLGDPRRWINWRASARHDQHLFVNQFEQERIADVGIILDARVQSDILLGDGSALFEQSVKAAGALADAFLEDNNRVGLLIYGFGMERVFPGYGKVQKSRIHQSLGSARTGHNFALESLRYLPTRFFPAGSQIVMVSPLLSSDIQAFTRLRANGYEVLVVSPNPVDFEARSLGLYGLLPWQLAKIERALMLHKLTRMGVRILDWDVSRPFEPLVRTALRRAPIVRRVVVA